MRAPSRQTLAGLVIIAVFVLILALPLAQHPRKLRYAVWNPEAGWSDSFAEVERRFRKRFAFTDELLALQGRSRSALFGTWPAAIIQGRDGWYFYDSDRSKDGSTMEDYRGQAMPAPDLLESWCGILAGRDRELAANGIPYLVVMAPNKQSVMSDRLPRWIQAQRGASTRADMVLPALGSRLRAPPLDLRPTMSALAAAGGDPYLRTDSHWSPESALAASNATITALAPLLPGPPLLPIDASTWSRRRLVIVGDILTMARLANPRPEDTFCPDPPAELPARMPDGRPVIAPGWNPMSFSGTAWQNSDGGNRLLVLSNPAGRPGTLLLVHDSFGATMAPYLAQYFQRTVCLWGHWPREAIQSWQPAAVVHQTAERYLDHIFW